MNEDNAPELYCLVVLPEHRAGRGVYRRPGGYGYTDRLESAGKWSLDAVPNASRASAFPLSWLKAHGDPFAT